MLSKSYKILEKIEEEGNLIVLPSFIIPEPILRDHPEIIKRTFVIKKEGEPYPGKCVYLSSSANPCGDRYEVVINGENIVLWI